MSRFKTINREELKAKLDRREKIQLVNVLGWEHEHLGSIPGSHRIPADNLASGSAELNKNLEVIAYCAGPQCDASRRAASILDSLGFRVSAYEGGIEDWKKAGYPLEGEGAKLTRDPKKIQEARIDEELKESFPASDPPSWASA